MHIIWITTQFPNGTENKNGMFIYRTVRELSKYYSITVIALHPVIPPIIPMIKNIGYAKRIFKEWRQRFPSNPQKPIGLENINVIYSKFFRPPRAKDDFWEGWFVYKSIKNKIKNIIKKEKVILHATWLFPEGRAAYLLNKKFEVPYVVTLMGSDVNYLEVGTKKYEYAKKIFFTASMVTSVSQALFNTCKKKGILLDEKKNVLTHTVYDTEKFSLMERKEIRKKANIDEKLKIIFFAGALRKLKNVDKLIRSVSEIKKNNKKIKLFIAGTGFEEGNLKNLTKELNVEKNVEFLGNIEPGLLVEYYNIADVFCLPSKNEGLPNVVIESLLCGTPVVVSEVGELPFIIKENQNGFLVKPNSIESLTEKLNLALNKKWDRKSLRQSVEFLNTKNVIQEYRNVYNKVYNNQIGSNEK